MGARLGGLLQAGDVICLSGDMGAGKTVFAAGIGAGWGSRQPLTSPTYSLVHQHIRDADDQRLHHLDCYRLEDAAEAEGIGLDDILDGEGPVVMEWPERIQDVLPEDRLWVELRILEVTRRNLIFNAQGRRHQAIIAAFRSQTFGV